MKNRYVIITDGLGIEPDAIQDDEAKILFEQCNFDMDKLCDLLNEKDQQLHDLQEQLKNAIVPKFKIGQEVFFVIDKVEQAKVEKLIFTIGKLDDETMKFYSITDAYGYALRLPEEQIFATREAAENRLAELKGE